MRTTNLAPHHTELGVLDLLLGLVDVCDPLANVELCVVLGADTINLQQSAIGVAVGLAALVAQDDTLGIQAHGLLALLDRLLRLWCLYKNPKNPAMALCRHRRAWLLPLLAVHVAVLAPPFSVPVSCDYLASWEAQERAWCKAGGQPSGLAPSSEIKERQKLKGAILELRKEMTSLRLGIMAPSALAATETLDAWLSGLDLPVTKIQVVDPDNQPLDESIEGSVYLKYSYAEKPDETKISAYMKAYPFAGRGVLFNPDLPDGEMHMYGDFPLALFEEV